MDHPYILTHSGARVSATAGVPTIDDIALALSRAPRFAGHTRVPYTVLDHSLFAAALCAREQPGSFPMQLAVLLHDAHEAVTADNPSPFKNAQIRAIQEKLDERISVSICVNACDELFGDHAQAIKIYDRRALLAEAFVVGPPTLVTPEDVREHFGDAPSEADVAVLRDFLRTESKMDEKRKVFVALTAVLRLG